ncbi:MAG: adenylate/guanylate cyclase domain-containing protein [Stellaceae bacterium]|jgi:adenylate cyclase
MDPKILVVDDNEDNRYTLVRRLRREGYPNVVVAENGRRALDLIETGRIDLVLLDIMMPEMNGYDVLERIKAHPSWREIPVIMISAIEDIDSVVRCIVLGAEDYLPKPFNPVLLRARVGSSLEKKRLRDSEALYLQRLETEKRRGDELLHAILPPSAVAELREHNEVKPRRHENVTVLFADIVGFTRYCDQTPAEKVVAELRALVDRYEDIVAAQGMEKIKTIGDAFLATASLLQPLEDGVLAAVRCGQAMIAVAQSIEPRWLVRVGIHCGSVVAGIMGRRQYLFDLWGDTVNTAARITAGAEGGTILMSGAAWSQVRGRCTGQSRGLIELKGKGALELFVCSRIEG